MRVRFPTRRTVAVGRRLPGGRHGRHRNPASDRGGELRRVAEALIEEEEISGRRVVELLGLEEKTASAGAENGTRGAA
jgi:hypothetical protein